MIAVIDYGLGNLRSVAKALKIVGAEVEITNSPAKIEQAKALILPGVGAFYRGMENLKKAGLIPPILKSIRENKPFLGICLGLQLLFTESEEHGFHQGLDIIKGKVKKLDSQVKIPHMGWNQVKSTVHPKGQACGDGQSTVFEGIPDNSYFYFVHSFYVEPENEGVIIGTTEYGQEFVSAVNKDNVWGVQFHPEKSSDLGLKILKSFISLI